VVRPLIAKTAENGKKVKPASGGQAAKRRNSSLCDLSGLLFLVF
jgi:hypothetical protein